jgi:hypothetical protein
MVTRHAVLHREGVAPIHTWCPMVPLWPSVGGVVGARHTARGRYPLMRAQHAYRRGVLHGYAVVVERSVALLLLFVGGERHGGPSRRNPVARQLRDSSRLRLDGHLAVALSNIARMVTLNRIKDAVLDARLNANGLEAMTPPVTWCNVLVGHHGANELSDPVLDTLQWAQHVTA